MLQQTQTSFLSLQEMHLKSQAEVMLNFGDLTSAETCQSPLTQPMGTLKLPHLICVLVTCTQKQVLLIFTLCCLYAFARKDMDNHSILQDERRRERKKEQIKSKGFPVKARPCFRKFIYNISPVITGCSNIF